MKNWTLLCKSDIRTRMRKKNRKMNLQHLIDIACSKHLVHTGKLVWLVSRKVRSKDAVLSTSAAKKLACRTWRNCTLFPTTVLHSSECRVYEIHGRAELAMDAWISAGKYENNPRRQNTRRKRKDKKGIEWGFYIEKVLDRISLVGHIALDLGGQKHPC